MGPEVWRSVHNSWVAWCSECEAQTWAGGKILLLCNCWCREDSIWSRHWSVRQDWCRCKGHQFMIFFIYANVSILLFTSFWKKNSLNSFKPIDGYLIISFPTYLVIGVLICLFRIANTVLVRDISATWWKRLRANGGTDYWSREGNLLPFWKLIGINGLMKMKRMSKMPSVSDFKSISEFLVFIFHRFVSFPNIVFQLYLIWTSVTSTFL